MFLCSVLRCGAPVLHLTLTSLFDPSPPLSSPLSRFAAHVPLAHVLLPGSPSFLSLSLTLPTFLPMESSSPSPIVLVLIKYLLT